VKPLQGLRIVLRELAQEAEVLPAVGGAVEDLERPDFEEREDQALNEDEKVFEIVFERDPLGEGPRMYRPVPPVRRSEQHLLRYFLDGSFRSYFLGTILEGHRQTPVHFAQIGACLLRREDDGTVRRANLRVENLLLVGRQQLSESLWQRIETWARDVGIQVVDLTERDVVSDILSDFDLRNKAGGKVRYKMRNLEGECMGEILGNIGEHWSVADGSLLFDPILQRLLNCGRDPPPVMGVSKNFRKDPQFTFGRGPRKERRSIYQLLADLPAEHRTAAFSAREGRVVFWYVRLREQRHLDYPLMGVVKAELVNPSQEPVDPTLLDLLSQVLVAERTVAPHGLDRRWHAHLYPIYLAERAVRESLFSREVVQQFVRWR
jgi:hypothetical protein